MKKEISRRRYSPEFKQDAIKLAESIGVGEAANKLNIPLSSLQRWKCQKNIPIEKSFLERQCLLSRTQHVIYSVEKDRKEHQL